jgi:hypothetical protein
LNAETRERAIRSCGSTVDLLGMTLRRTTRYGVLAATTAFLTFGLVLPAGAVPGGTTATITIQGGSLSITVPADAGNLGTATNTVGGEVISGSLGVVTVSDARNAAAGSGWVASVISTAFTPGTGAAIGAAFVGYTAGTITKTGTATYTANDPPNLTGVSPAVTATGITGDNSATWNPTISVTVAGGTLTNVYSATITHSVV